MSDRLEEIKDSFHQYQKQAVSDEDIIWLIAEVERLRIGPNVNHDIYKSQKDQIESLTKERDDLLYGKGLYKTMQESIDKLEAERDRYKQNDARRMEINIKLLKENAELKKKSDSDDRAFSGQRAMYKELQEKLGAVNADLLDENVELIREGDELAIIADEKAAEIQKKLDASEKARKDVEEKQDTLFDAIKHGETPHQIWLRKAIKEHFE